MTRTRLAPTTFLYSSPLRLHLFEKRAFLFTPFEYQAFAFDENHIAQVIELFKRGGPFERLRITREFLAVIRHGAHTPRI